MNTSVVVKHTCRVRGMGGGNRCLQICYLILQMPHGHLIGLTGLSSLGKCFQLLKLKEEEEEEEGNACIEMETIDGYGM